MSQYVSFIYFFGRGGGEKIDERYMIYMMWSESYIKMKYELAFNFDFF